MTAAAAAATTKTTTTILRCFNPSFHQCLHSAPNCFWRRNIGHGLLGKLFTSHFMYVSVLPSSMICCQPNGDNVLQPEQVTEGLE